jgi:hypothetical protein
MATRGARRAFELFLYLAHRALAAADGAAVSPSHEELCRACGLAPAVQASRPALSRLLRELRQRYEVIDFNPVQRRRPEIRLLPPQGASDPHHPPHYVWLTEPWSAEHRAIFDHQGADAFAAEYLYLIADYQAEVASRKHGRLYWFMPLAQLAKFYHLSEQFAGRGLRALVRLGVLSVTPGQYGRPNQEHFGPANRYYFGGLGAIQAREEKLQDVEKRYDRKVFVRASRLALRLLNGATAKNVEGICELICEHGARRVENAVKSLGRLPPRSLCRRVGYVSALLASPKEGPAGRDSGHGKPGRTGRSRAS